MFRIRQTLSAEGVLEFMEIENSQKTTYAKIHINEGASLQELRLNSQAVIVDLAPLTYNNTYASSILFPFANRIKDGTYHFNSQEFQFEINEPGNHNALHGLVYNKTFQIINQEETKDFAAITFEYVENNNSMGFPYTYTMQVEYVISENALEIRVQVKNTDAKAFPFTIGWHPYFNSSDLYNSSLQFDSDKKLVFDARCITTGVETIESTSNFKVEDKKLDDCYILNTNQTRFITPDYKLLLTASSQENFLQIYMPPKKNVVAIEPTTGVSDSFNNGMGLQILESNEKYEVCWKVEVA